MTFSETVDYLNSLNKFGSVLGLDNMRALLCKLGEPQNNLKLIHVTGTNGKGSVCTFLSSILKCAGYSAGTYNSPAVIHEHDQYKINCEIAGEEDFADAVSAVKNACDELKHDGIFPTRFEVETAAAFVLFNNKNTDIAIIETGLGGKDDATAVIENALLHVITTISKDHIPVLGNNLKDIAGNKSHIIKTSAPTVAYRSDDETFEIIKKRCDKFSSPLHVVYENDIENFKYKDRLKSYFTDTYQSINTAIAINAAYSLKKLGYNISDENIVDGINASYIPFRFEKIHDDPVVIADGAHNPDGAKKLIESLKKVYGGFNYIFVTGIFKDKDYEKICEITGRLAKTVFAVCNDRSERSLDIKTLENTLKKYNDNVLVCGTIEESILCAMKHAREDDDSIVVLFGSLSWLERAGRFISQGGAYENSGQTV